ncbi:MAG: hypothetical protein WBF79_10745 [Rhodococcus sp. (in: high G+C Gram-positive bacteria)]
MSTPNVPTPGGTALPSGTALPADTPGLPDPIATCLSEHPVAGFATIAALCVVTGAFVAVAVSSPVLGALVAVLMIGVAVLAAVLVPVERR